MKDNEKYDIIVVGGGPAGLLAAGRASQLGAKVLLLEKMRQTGRKLCITGKGRCNITNEGSISDFLDVIYPNPKFLRTAFNNFFNEDILRILEENGLETIHERGGRVFPKSNRAQDVHAALLKWVTQNGVTIRTAHKVEHIEIENNTIIGLRGQIFNEEKFNYSAKKIILGTGGNSYPATGSDGQGYKLAKEAGHKIEAILPALVPLETEGKLATQLQGLSLKNIKAILWVNNKKVKEEFGEMLFTHFGLSGPIILTLSRFVSEELRLKNKVEITLDLKPALDEQKLDQRLMRDLNENGKKLIKNIFSLWVPSKLIPVMLELNALNPEKECHQINQKERKSILYHLKNFKFHVTGTRSFAEAIITKGGVCTSEIDQKSMQSKIIKNLYFAGELIDLDAQTGGYNLQIAYSTGWLAGESAAYSL